MFVIGTAGHVDHGKSTLVKALTGVDPDRLQEEQERGMTIDLGFSWLTLPSGRDVSIVDVPGHERFIKNMLAGAGGIDLAWLVIAADEGVMPQTREHLAILDLLQVKSGVLVVSKRELVDADWLALVQEDVRAAVIGTALEAAPQVAVSSVTREGLPELLAVTDRLLEECPGRQDLGRPRLPIDRVFTIAGFGTVVTGTLSGGHLEIGQEVEVAPGGLRARIRGLQTHRQKVERAEPGARTAVNLTGLAKGDLARGMVLTLPGLLKPTEAADVRLRLLAEASPLKHNAEVNFHSGSAEALARTRLLDRDELKPGETALAQLRLDRPLALARGDLFILRSPSATLGGGTVLEPHARRHRRRDEGALVALAAVERGAPDDILLKTLEAQGVLEETALLERSGLPVPQARPALAGLTGSGRVRSLGGAATYLISTAGWERVSARARAEVEAHHRQFPLRWGMPREELKSRLGLPRGGDEALAALVQAGALQERGPSIRLPGQEVRLSAAQESRLRAFLDALEANPYSPPSPDSSGPDPELLAVALEREQAVKVTDGMVFGARAYREMVQRVVDYLKAHDTITLAQVRDLFGTSRKYAQGFLEHLDQTRVTRRVGDERVLR
ncbi:MAG: selenocysteine-specific translation elongation factor [Dehalococcoidia bacterium]|nr:selenocysteine-specific translation elongation factor [Dehalococcoidia bacterium]